MKNKFSLSALFQNSKFMLIFSLIAACIIWASVSPSGERSITTSVNISTKGTALETLGLSVVQGANQQISVNVSGKKYVISSLSGKDFDLVPAFEGVTSPGQYNIKINVTSKIENTGYTIDSVSPEYIPVTFDRVITSNMPINVVATGVKAAQGLIAEPAIITSGITSLNITGPENAVKNIDKVVVKAEVNETLGQSKNFAGTLSLYNKSDEEISKDSFTFDVNEFTVTVPIVSKKQVSLKAQFNNQPEFFKKTPLSYKFSTEKIMVTGPEDVLKNLTSVSLSPINFEEISKSNNVFVCTIVLPSGVKCADEITGVNVTIDLSKYSQKSFTLSEFKAVNASVDYVTETRSKKVTIMAPTDIINTITEKDLYLECDMSELDKSTGEHIVKGVVKSTKFTNIWGIGTYDVQFDIE